MGQIVPVKTEEPIERMVLRVTTKFEISSEPRNMKVKAILLYDYDGVILTHTEAEVNAQY